MKEAIGVEGNELSYANTGYSIASIISGFVGGILMVTLNTRWYILTIESLWTLVTFCFVLIKTPTQMIVLRTFIGLLEGSHFAVLMFLVGGYYLKTEVARRCNLINAFTAIGPMCAYALQSRASALLDKVNGYAGWQWCFLLDGIISTGVLIFQFFFQVDKLESLTPNWFWSQEEIDYLRSRLPAKNEDENSRQINKITLVDLKKFLLTWKVYPIWLYSILNNFVQEPAAAIPFYFKGWNAIKPGSYTTPQINNLTIPLYAVQLVTSIVSGWLSDVVFKGDRWQVMAIGISWSTVVYFYLGTHKIFEAHRATILFFMYNSGVAQGVAGQFWAQAQDSFESDSKLRSFVTGGINPASGVCGAIVGPLLYPSSKLPEVYTGYLVSGGAGIAYVLLSVLFGLYLYLEKKKTIEITNTC